MQKKFKRAYIEITNICNLQCDFCPKTERKLSYMDFPSFEYILKEIKPHTNYIYLHLMGEPLLNKNLPDFLLACAKNDIQVNMTTNGTLLKQYIKTFIDAPALRQINISLHSFEANSAVKDVSDYLKHVTETIQEIHKNRKLFFSLRLWNMDNERLQLQGKNDHNETILTFLQEKLQAEADIGTFLSDSTAQSLKLREQVFLHKAEKFQWPSLGNPILSDDIFCHGLRDHFGILVDGTVVPCCLDGEGKMPLGNIFEEPLQNILNSERAKNIYDGFSRRCAVEDLCKTCGYAERFSRT